VTQIDTTADHPVFQSIEVFAAVGEVPYEWRIDSDALAWGANAAEVIKVADLQLIASGRGFAKLLDPDTVQTRFDAVMRTNAKDKGAGVPYQIQYGLRPRPGTDAKLWIEDVGRWFAGPDGKPARALGVLRVINERRAQEERLAYLSRFDGLTGELNRWHLTDVLSAAIDDATRNRGCCAFLIVAVDNLTRINEAYGFDVADEVISAVAKRLRAKMRGGDSVGRYSGNKFGVVLKSCTPDDIATAAERLLAGVRDDVVQTQAGPVAVTVTIGGVNAPRHARSVGEVLARAQEALDAAKAKRRGSFHAYRPSVERDALRRQNVRSSEEIVRALNEGRVAVAFEPVVATASRAPAFYECLMRIRRADGGVIGAGEIIPLAERLGLVRLIDRRMLELVVAELVAAPALNASLNVSAASTVDPDWWTALAAALGAHGDLARRLTIEITESAAIQDLDDTRGFVARVKDLGCRIAIDDFGAGYTSFRNLRKLGVDLIKIDGAFVQNLTRSGDDRAFVRTLIELAQRLGLATVAEWVQDEAGAALLAEWGCSFLQGHLIGLASLDRPWAAQSSAA
jgi:diguanylate cyclase (GGDEF)-like protein